MLSKTLQSGLADYGIGEKIRGLRLKKKMGLVELGAHTDLSAALLSKIERGRLFPTLPTLLRIALVFAVGLDFFFAGPRDQPLLAIVRRKDRLRFPAQPGRREGSFRFESLDFTATERRFNSYLAEFFPATPETMTRHAHAGVEFIHVLKGALDLDIGRTAHTLQAGDSIYFDAGVTHGYRRQGARPCQALIVVTP
ncbi:MAG: XRE family transcriptional regulator [Acidobacteriota bacterium]